MDFQKANHTIILSDMHLSDAEPPHPRNPLWKRFKKRKFFIDMSFKRFLQKIENEAPEPGKELVLNGDIFDFDSVMELPHDPQITISWLEKRRGLSPEEPKSCFKMRIILRDHHIFVEALRDWVLKGNRLIFVIGNHDVELHWPSVQRTIVENLRLPDEKKELVRFCEWFYISNQDTLIEHGNQYDDYCMLPNSIHPLIKKGGRYLIRLPFGNMAGKLMLNGMGLMNPHVDSSFIKANIKEYLVFFYRYVVRVQPFLLWTWFWGAMLTLFYSVSEGLLPAVRDPFTVTKRVKEIAEKANSDPQTVRALQTIHSHPAIFNPIRIVRELWLDRAILLLFIFWFGFQVFSFVNIFTRVSIWAWLIPSFLLLPAFILYAQSVESEVRKVTKSMLAAVQFSSKITQVDRVVYGHTHQPMHELIHDIEVVNTGTWSPAFYDPECTQPYGDKCFAWISPSLNPDKPTREVKLYKWDNTSFFS